MSELRAYLIEYINKINELLNSCEDDEALRVAAEQRWKPADPRYLVFLERGLHELRMPLPPKDDDGEEVHRPNEIP
jgi:hypothetical protein